MDIKLYTRPTQTKDTELMHDAGLSDAAADALETLAGKVVRFLLTTKGTCALDLEYGGTAFSHNQISREFIPKLRLEVQRDITRCFKYIKSTEDPRDTSNRAKLGSIILREIMYNPYKTTGCAVKIEIVTTTGLTSLLDF